jgi:hypothetical protein
MNVTHKIGFVDWMWFTATKRNFDPDVTRTRNLLIWSQTRYHCATEPLE